MTWKIELSLLSAFFAYKSLLAVALTVLGLYPGANAIAGQYVLVQGRGVEVCEAYSGNLNSFEPAIEPMRCERMANSKSPDFSKPQWTALNARDYLELIITIREFLDADKKPRSEGYVGHLKDAINRGELGLAEARVDIDNDGRAERLLRYSDGECERKAGSWAKPLIVLDARRDQIDVVKTAPLLQNAEQTNENPAGGWTYAMYDVFTYKGAVYFDRWSDFVKETGVLRVFAVQKSGGAFEICRYRYN